MLEMIYRIPESLGWAMVGAVAMLTTILLIDIIKMLYLAIKMRIEDNEEGTEE